MPKEIAHLSGKLVIVDDDESICRAVRLICEQEGITVIGTANNGIDAEDLVRQHQPRFIVLDFKMPFADGETTARALRRISPNSLIIAFSAILDAQPEWADGFLAKDDFARLPRVLGTFG